MLVKLIGPFSERYLSLSPFFYLFLSNKSLECKLFRPVQRDCLSRLVGELPDYYRSDELPLNKYFTRALYKVFENREARKRSQTKWPSLYRNRKENEEIEWTAKSPAFCHSSHCIFRTSARRSVNFFTLLNCPVLLNFRTFDLSLQKS